MVKLNRERCSQRKHDFARKMRRNPTQAEARLWSYLRNRKLGFSFYRQALILGWIADFYCPSAQLIIEADGETHKAEQDEYRDKQIYKQTGIKTMRFSNEEILFKTFAVVVKIRKHIRAVPESSTDSTEFPHRFALHKARIYKKKTEFSTNPQVRRLRRDLYKKEYHENTNALVVTAPVQKSPLERILHRHLCPICEQNIECYYADGEHAVRLCRKCSHLLSLEITC